jgi:hypothetical protein
MQAGKPLHCVWSGRRLEMATLDIDHCLPWTAWPCGDLWNLLPAHRRVNQHEKPDRLQADDLLRRAAEPIKDWWQLAYLSEASPVLARRFADEAWASLPGLGGSTDSASEVFAAPPSADGQTDQSSALVRHRCRVGRAASRVRRLA